MGILMGNTEKSRGNGNSHGIPSKNPVGMGWEWEFKINSHGKPDKFSIVNQPTIVKYYPSEINRLKLVMT